MTDLQKLTAWMVEQIGVTEQPPGSNNVPYNTVYYGGQVSGDQYPWCCSFIWDGFYQTGLSSLFCGGEKTAWCPYVVNWAKAHGAWISADFRPGDLVLFDFNNDGKADHIGFVVAVSGTSLQTIEGNVDSAVRRMTRSVVGVMGACRPAYAAAAENAPQPATGGQAAESDAGETYIVQPYDSLWKIARDRLGDENRWPELQKFNGLDSTVIYPGQVLRLPSDPQPAPQPVPEYPQPPFAVETVDVPLPVLQSGISGRDVQAMQLLLIRAGYPLPVNGPDGVFGSETRAALLAFQQAMGLEPTGTTSGLTWATLIC